MPSTLNNPRFALAQKLTLSHTVVKMDPILFSVKSHCCSKYSFVVFKQIGFCVFGAQPTSSDWLLSGDLKAGGILGVIAARAP